MSAPGNNTDSTRQFLRIGKTEVYSFLFLLFIAMPVKYILHHPILVRIGGSVHGILFIAFLFMINRMLKEKRLNGRQAARALLLSLLPFGTFFLKKLL